MNQPPIPEIRIGKEPDKSKEKGANKSKRMHPNDDQAQFMRKINFRSKTKDFASTLPASRHSAIQED